MLKKFIDPAVVVATLLVLCLLAGVFGGIDFAPDVGMIHYLESIRAHSPQLTATAIGITQAGSAYGTVGGGLAVASWLAWKHEWRLAVLLGVVVLGERIVVDGLKLLVDRSRPAFDLHPVVTNSSSFPSGHAGNSMAVLLSIALIAVPRAHRLGAAIIAVIASLIIGCTRPFLGVHWPSDVIGGWSLGAAIAIIAGVIADRQSLEAPQ